MWWVSADEAAATPDRHEASILTDGGFRQPVRILASLAAAIDESAGKYVVVFQSPLTN